MRAVKAAGPADLTFEEAGNGVEALRAIRTSPPDLVLTDWNMPEMSGIELLEALRAEGNGVRLGFVTSEQNPNILARAHQAGALFVIAKPFPLEAIQAALARLG
jgi:two-component system chemotaxis response regulator CheY